MRKFLWLMSIAAAIAPGQTLIETDFGGAYQRVTGNPRITGALPAGWRDNSGFAQAWVTYSKMEENNRPFLRIEVTRVEDGWAQINTPMPRPEADGYIRLTVALRNPDQLLIGLGVRRNSAPYKYLWQESRSFPGAWSEQKFYGRLPQSEFDVGFYIVLNGGVGTLDISQFRLERVTLEEVQRDLAAEAPEAAAKNLARTSRFPLGLESGWSLDRDSSDEDDVRIAPDAETKGPSGAPALRITSDKFMQLSTAPFAVARTGEPHTGSLYLRGRGSGRLTAIADGRVIAQQSFKLEEGDWQRAAVRFTPDLLARAHGLRIEGSGDFWMDALQVERGSQATEYASQGRCEVSLAAESPLRVEFEDEPATVRYVVTGEAAGAVLRSKATNVYGEERTLPAVKIGSGFLNEGALRYDVFPARPYGSFRVEAWVEDAGGRRISPYNELVVHRLRRPRYWMLDAPDSPFGAHMSSTRRHILMAKAVGVNWNRLHDVGTSYIGWYNLERKPGEWTFKDAQIYRYRDLGMKVLGMLSTAPEWASYFKTRHEQYFDQYYQPRDMSNFANYVKVVTERYLGVIDAWDVWNEPWGSGYWGVSYDEARKIYVTSAHPEADFARLMKAGYQAAKSVDAGLTVLGVQTSAGSTGTKWTAGVAEAGGLESCDAICYHQYINDAPGYPGDVVESGWRSALAPVVDADGNAPKPVWMTEGSSLNGRIGNGLYRHTLPYAENEDVMDTADRLCRHVVALLAQGARKVFLYSMSSHNWFGVGSTWRTLVTEEGYLHPAAAAHSAMAWFLEGTKFARTSAATEGVTAYEFQGEGYSVTVLSPKAGHAPYAAPAETFDLFGNAVPAGEPLGRRLVYVVKNR